MKYRVTYYYEEGGTVVVSAASHEDAVKKVIDLMELDGVRTLNHIQRNKEDGEVSAREYYTLETEEVK